MSRDIREKNWNIFVATLLCVSLATCDVYAQEAEFESGQISRQVEQEKVVDELSAEAKEKQFRDGLKKVSYAEILKDPDNFELNYRYSQQQVKNNNLLGAAATLERILLVNPDLAKIRLFYAVVLFRLDNLDEAAYELEKLKELDMPDSLRSELDLYTKEIKRRQRRTSLEITSSTGFQVDTNRNASPNSKRRLFFEIPLNTTLGTTRQRDTSLIHVTNVKGSYDLGFQAGHELIGNFTYYLGEQTKLDSLDLQSFQYELGGVYKTRFGHITPTFEHNIVYLSRQIFLRTQALKARYDKKFKKADLFARFKLERQDYRRISENARAIDRRGNLFDYEIGADFKITPTMKILTNIGYTNKNAKTKFEGYEKLYFGLGHTWVFWKGNFLINSVDVGFDYYDEPEVAVAGRFRRDKSLRYRVSHGMPLASIPFVGEKLPRLIGDVTLTNTFEYYRASSNITNYTYTNFKYQTLLTKRFRF